MVLYNVTINVDWYIHDEWLQWMKEVYIPDMLDNNYFFDYRVFRLLRLDETDGPTYAVQYFADSMDKYNMFVEKQLDISYQLETSKWGNKFVSFSTIMELVH